MSFVLALFFITSFVIEVLFGLNQVSTLYLKDKAELTKIEKDLKEFYYEGLDEESIKMSWWVRNYNLIFTTRFMLVCLFIYTFQFLSILQVMMSVLLLCFCFLKTLANSFKLNFFKSKVKKYVRVI
jgi:hypothetical protein